MKLVDEFKDQVPGNIDFNIGYYDGAQHSKVWLVSVDDLKSMYLKHPFGGEIVLFPKAVNVEKSVSSPSTLATANIISHQVCRVADEKFEQLRYLQQLLEDGI